MTAPFIHDDIVEVVLRSRAGDAAPADLRIAILAAVAADGPRVVARRRRTAGHPWRLLAVAAVLLATLGTAVLVGSQRRTDPPPSQLAVVPSVSASPTPTPIPTAGAFDLPSAAPIVLPAATPSLHCASWTNHPVPGRTKGTTTGHEIVPSAFGSVAEFPGSDPWQLFLGGKKSPLTEVAHGGRGSPTEVSASADHRRLLVTNQVSGGGLRGGCWGLFLIDADAPAVTTLVDGTSVLPITSAISASGDRIGWIAWGDRNTPALTISDRNGGILSQGIRPCQRGQGVPTWPHLAWSPNGSRLVINCGYAIDIVRLVDGTAEVGQFPAGSAISATALTWTSDGTALMVAAVTNTGLAIKTISPEDLTVTSTVQVADHSDWSPSVGDYKFSPDGRWLLAGAGGQTPFHAFLVDTGSGATIDFDACAGGMGCMWTFDSRIVVPTDPAEMLTVPGLNRVATWDGGLTLEFTLLP